MYYVYVLIENRTKRSYIGFSSDLKQRISDHDSGRGCKTTKGGSWQLVYYEAFASKEDALERERKLKHHGMAKKKLFERLSKSFAGQNRAGEAPK